MEFLATLAERIALIGLGDATTPDEQEAERLMADEAYVPFRRRRLPLGMTGGREVYAFDLMILGDYLPDRDRRAANDPLRRRARPGRGDPDDPLVGCDRFGRREAERNVSVR